MTSMMTDNVTRDLKDLDIDAEYGSNLNIVSDYSNSDAVEVQINEKESSDDTQGVSDRAQWLQDAFKKKTNDDLPKSKVSPSGSLVSDRMKWLKAQNETKKASPKNLDIGVKGGSASEKAKWLQGEAFKKDIEKTSTKAREELENAGVSAADKVKWMQDSAFQKKEVKTANVEEELSSIGISAAQKAKWLEDPTSHQKEIARATENAQAELTAAGISASDRAKWLEDPATHKKEIARMANALEEIGAAGVSAADKVKWMQNKASDSEEVVSKTKPSLSTSGAAEKKKWLESAFKKEKEEVVEVKEEKVSKVKNVASIFGGTEKPKALQQKPKTAIQLKIERLKEKERLEKAKNSPPTQKKVWTRPKVESTQGNPNKTANPAPKKSLGDLP